ncbi:MAG: IclR family transcriptional regulator [Pseudomonadota bacterium]
MTIQSVNRAMDILFLFTNATPRLGITDMSKLLGLTKPTVHGLVQTLAKRGFLYQDSETRKYSLGLKIHELGTILSCTLKINQVGAGPARRLADATNYMIRIAIWDRGEILVTFNVFPGSQTINYQQLGPRVPAYCSASGKALLSMMPSKRIAQYLKETTLKPFTPNTITTAKDLKKELEKARSNGYAEDHEEYLPGLFCVSAPIFNQSGNPYAAISVSGGFHFFSNEELDTISQQMKETAAEISRSMGYFQQATPL